MMLQLVMMQLLFLPKLENVDHSNSLKVDILMLVDNDHDHDHDHKNHLINPVDKQIDHWNAELMDTSKIVAVADKIDCDSIFLLEKKKTNNIKKLNVEHEI